MRILVDTQALLWWLIDSERLGPRSRRMIMSETPVISPVVLWEIAIKSGLGKLDADVGEVCAVIAEQGFDRLGLTDQHFRSLTSLEHHHRDPFDRMLIAQARCEDMHILTADGKFELYDVKISNAHA
ncbi:MAG: type II toxin-antitoxin system VapC family toxin [Geminicoccaceae bacterium]|nr:type II toxin-antitoxin system VapC family toxin [Geminicoccaceae bacterium]